jgi:hypothetical protein
VGLNGRQGIEQNCNGSEGIIPFFLVTNVLIHVQAAARKRSRRYILETDEYVTGNSEGIKMDLVTVTTAYQKMKSLCNNLRNEIFTDIEIHNQHILPR